MALRYPFLAVIVAVVAVLAVAAVLFLVNGRRESHAGGRRVANTGFAFSLASVKARKRRRKAVYAVVEVVVAVSLAFSAVLAARPSQVITTSDAAQRKDIMLCLDVSTSICDMNYDIVNTLRDIVGSLGGERMGITIYNTSAVLYVPLTDDYEYVQTALDDLKKLFDAQKAYMDYSVFSWYDVDTEALWYFEEGTIVNADQKGSSLIGEGLASAMYSFPGLGKKGDDRTRLIIMSTDNAEEQGEVPPLIRFPEAAAKCAENNIKVLGIFPAKADYYIGSTTPYQQAIDEFTSGIEQTGGQVYQTSSSSSAADIIKEINREEAKLVKANVRTRFEDEPVTWYAWAAVMSSLVLALRAVSRS